MSFRTVTQQLGHSLINETDYFDSILFFSIHLVDQKFQKKAVRFHIKFSE